MEAVRTRDLDADSDAALVAATKSGEPLAFETLVLRHKRRVFALAQRITNNHEDAEEAVQNCLQVASDRAPRFDHEGAFRSWLARILIDEAVTILHKQRSSTPRHW